IVGAGRSRGIGQRNGSAGRDGRSGSRNHDHGRGQIIGCGGISRGLARSRRRELVILVHPTFPLAGPSGDRGEVLTTGYLGETTMAATKLVLAGILDESPGYG